MNLKREPHTQQANCGAVATKGLIGLIKTVLLLTLANLGFPS